MQARIAQLSKCLTTCRNKHHFGAVVQRHRTVGAATEPHNGASLPAPLGSPLLNWATSAQWCSGSLWCSLHTGATAPIWCSCTMVHLCTSEKKLHRCKFAPAPHPCFIYTRYEQIPNISPKYALVSILEQFENSWKNRQKIIGAALKLK